MEDKRDDAFLRQIRVRDAARRKQKCRQRSGLVLVMLLLGVLLYMLRTLINELNRRRAHKESVELRKRQRDMCHKALLDLKVPRGVSKDKCLDQKRDFRAGHFCHLQCEENRTQVGQQGGKVLDMKITCKEDGDWAHNLAEIGLGYKAEDLLCKRKPTAGACLKGPPLDSREGEKDTVEYVRFDFVNKASQWHVTRARALDYWTLPVNGDKYKVCVCQFAQEKTCSFEWNLGVGGNHVQPLEMCHEDADLKSKWRAAEVNTIEVKYGLQQTQLLKLDEYWQKWWCVDTKNKPIPCKFLLTQSGLVKTLNVIDATGRDVPGKVTQLDVTRDEDKAQPLTVEPYSLCQLLRAAGGPDEEASSTKYDDFKDHSQIRIITAEFAKSLNWEFPKEHAALPR